MRHTDAWKILGSSGDCRAARRFPPKIEAPLRRCRGLWLAVQMLIAALALQQLARAQSASTPAPAEARRVGEAEAGPLGQPNDQPAPSLPTAAPVTEPTTGSRHASKSRMWVVIIDIQHYDNADTKEFRSLELRELNGATNDGDAMQRLFENMPENEYFPYRRPSRRAGTLIRLSSDRTRSDRQPTHENVQRVLDGFANGRPAFALEPGDLLIFYFTGHGGKDPNRGQCLLLQDTVVHWKSGRRTLQNALPVEELKGVLDRAKDFKVKVCQIFDSCGNSFDVNSDVSLPKGGNAAIQDDPLRGPKLDEYSTGFGCVSISACQPGQFSWSYNFGTTTQPEFRGVFSKYFEEGMLGGKDLDGTFAGRLDEGGRGVVSISKVFMYAASRTRDLTRRYNNNGMKFQDPDISMPKGADVLDFDIYAWRSARRSDAPVGGGKTTTSPGGSSDPHVRVKGIKLVEAQSSAPAADPVLIEGIDATFEAVLEFTRPDVSHLDDARWVVGWEIGWREVWQESQPASPPRFQLAGRSIFGGQLVVRATVCDRATMKPWDSGARSTQPASRTFLITANSRPQVQFASGTDRSPFERGETDEIAAGQTATFTASAGDTEGKITQVEYALTKKGTDAFSGFIIANDRPGTPNVEVQLASPISDASKPGLHTGWRGTVRFRDDAEGRMKLFVRCLDSQGFYSDWIPSREFDVQLPKTLPRFVSEDFILPEFHRIQGGRLEWSTVAADSATVGQAVQDQEAVGVAELRLEPYFISSTQISREEFRKYVSAKGLRAREYPGLRVSSYSDADPMTGLTVAQMLNYATWLTEVAQTQGAGVVYRLPTEPEWEMAAMELGLPNGATRVFETDPSLGADFVKVRLKSRLADGAPIPLVPPDASGLRPFRQFLGSVYEITQGVDAQAPAAAPRYVRRGGPVLAGASMVSCRRRLPVENPEQPDIRVGFRLVRDVAKAPMAK